jgi:hypothetical protein
MKRTMKKEFITGRMKIILPVILNIAYFIGGYMSAFLGPIHYWLYNKINLQNSMVDKIIIFSEKQYPGQDLRKVLDEEFGRLESKPLEEMIDTTNIHGWLQEKVTLVEYRLAYSVTEILKQNPEALDQLKEIFYEFGKEISNNADNSNINASDIFKSLNDTLLDGMPCDHANTLVSEEEKEVIWKRNVCVHSNYWEEVGGDIRNYYILREEFIKGYVNNIGAAFEKVDETTSRITI